MFANKLNSNNFQNIKKTLIMQELFNVIETFSMFSSDFLGLLIFILGILQPQTYFANNVEPFLSQFFL